MTDEQLFALISTALAAGSGWAIQWCYSEYLGYRADAGKAELSAFRKRWAMIALTVLVPSVLYTLYCLGTSTPLDWVQDVAYVGAAFIASQANHANSLPRTPNGV